VAVSEIHDEESAQHRAWMREPITEPRYKWLRLAARLEKARRDRDNWKRRYDNLHSHVAGPTAGLVARVLHKNQLLDDSSTALVRGRLSEIEAIKRHIDALRQTLDSVKKAKAELQGEYELQREEIQRLKDALVDKYFYVRNEPRGGT
jgi:predicted  nucleic acid-binding Zn-ribbon protein